MEPILRQQYQTDTYNMAQFPSGFQFPILDSSGNPTSTIVDMEDMFVRKELFLDAGLWGSGANNLGQLGIGTVTNHSSPNQIGALTTWKQVACGYQNTAALKVDGTLWTWGRNTYGELGDGTVTNKSSPIQVGSLNNWRQVAAGLCYTSVVKTDGTLWCWGLNNNGQLGNGTTVYYSSPIQVGSLTNWRQVACGYYHTAAIQSDGSLWTWGMSSSGQLGYSGTKVIIFDTPGSGTWTIPGDWNSSGNNTIAAYGGGASAGFNNAGYGGGFAAGYNTPLTAGADTFSYKVGAGGSGGSNGADSTVTISGSHSGGMTGGGGTGSGSGAGITTTPWASFVLYSGGSPYNIHGSGMGGGAAGPGGNGGSGSGTAGGAGDPSFVKIGGPGDIAGGSGGGTLLYYVFAGSAGSEFIAGKLAGSGGGGQGFDLVSGGPGGNYGGAGGSKYGSGGVGAVIIVYTPTSVNPTSPTRVGTLTNWRQVSAGNFHTAAVKTDGTLWTWGLNVTGQLGNNTSVSYSSPIQVGSLTNWKYVSCGYNGFTTAIKTDGTLWAWGNNSNGQLGNGNNISLSSPIMVGALNTWKQVNQTSAIKSDGTMWVWGSNNYGQLGNGTAISYSSPIQVGSLTDWKQVSMAYDHIIAISSPDLP